jgi:CheY-like chemotaxis protein
MSAKYILLVEDDPSDARLIQRAFNKAEIHTTIHRLTNGDDAIAYLQGEPPYDMRVQYPFPTVLILDLKLPRRSGLEVLQWIRNLKDGRRRLPVIMLTSSRHAVDINRAYDLGANSYVTKPDSIKDLQEFASQFQKYWLALNEQPEITGTA